MTLNALAQSLITSLDDNVNDTAYVEVVEQWIKDALSELNLETRWHWARGTTNFSTVAGVATYNLPSGLGEISHLRLVSPRRVIEYVEHPMYLAAAGRDLAEQGTPEFWWFNGDIISGGESVMQIQLTPVPQQIYVIERFGVYNVESLSSSDNIPLMADMIAALKDRVRAYMLENDKDYDGADRAFQRFRNSVATAMKRLNTQVGIRNSTMQATDLPTKRHSLARLDPDHF